MTNKILTEKTGCASDFWKQGKFIVLGAAVVVERMKDIMDGFDQKAGDLKTQMKNLKPLLEVEIKKELPKLPQNGMNDLSLLYT